MYPVLISAKKAILDCLPDFVPTRSPAELGIEQLEFARRNHLEQKEGDVPVVMVVPVAPRRLGGGREGGGMGRPRRNRGRGLPRRNRERGRE